MVAAVLRCLCAAVTGLPIKFLGTGEKLDGLEIFDAERIAGRILGQGDIVALVEKATDIIDEKEAAALQKKMEKGVFDLDDLAKQLGQINKMGGMGGLMKLMPGMGKMRKAVDQMGGVDNKLLARQQAIIFSMTPYERTHPKLIKASRKKRIAAGSGMNVADVNKLLKMHRGMSDMMKKMGKGGMRGMMNAMGGGGSGMPGGMGGGMPDMDPKMLEDMQNKMGGSAPKGLPGLGKGMGGKGLPGLGGGLPGLGGSPKKK